jgi:hypothetical protein
MPLASWRDTENFHLLAQHALQNGLDLRSVSLKVYEMVTHLSYQLPLPLHTAQQEFPYEIPLQTRQQIILLFSFNSVGQSQGLYKEELVRNPALVTTKVFMMSTFSYIRYVLGRRA